MQLKVVIETQEEFNKWIENNGDKKRLTFSGKEVKWYQFLTNKHPFEL